MADDVPRALHALFQEPLDFRVDIAGRRDPGRASWLLAPCRQRVAVRGVPAREHPGALPRAWLVRDARRVAAGADDEAIAAVPTPPG